MFIAGWLIILILEANSVVVPALVSGIVGWLAVAEMVLYAFVIIMNVALIIISRKEL